MVIEGNAPAINLYESCGFTFTGLRQSRDRDEQPSSRWPTSSVLNGDGLAEELRGLAHALTLDLVELTRSHGR